MARPILVLLLIFSMFLSGCASPNGLTRTWDRWSDRPVVRTTTDVLVIAGVAALAVAAVALWLWAGGGDE